MVWKSLFAVSLLVSLSIPFAQKNPSGERVLPPGVKVIWDIDKAYRETTETRERVCINGLWQWQPAEPEATQVPTDGWGYFKVPGPWPGITDYMQKRLPSRVSSSEMERCADEVGFCCLVSTADKNPLKLDKPPNRFASRICELLRCNFRE